MKNNSLVEVENIVELIELNIEEGIEKAISEIEKLLKVNKYISISITWSSHDVWKTYLFWQISQRLLMKNIPIASIADTSILSKPFFSRENEWWVLIIETERIIYNEFQRELQNEAILSLEFPIKTVNLRIYIYIEERPFSDIWLKYADILIKNWNAVDKIRYSSSYNLNEILTI